MKNQSNRFLGDQATDGEASCRESQAVPAVAAIAGLFANQTAEDGASVCQKQIAQMWRTPRRERAKMLNFEPAEGDVRNGSIHSGENAYANPTPA